MWCGVSGGRFWLASESWSPWMRDLQGFVSLCYQSFYERLCRSVTSSIFLVWFGLVWNFSAALCSFSTEITSDKIHYFRKKTHLTWFAFSVPVDLGRCLRLEWCVPIMTVIGTRQGVVELESKLWCRNFMAYGFFVGMLSRMQTYGLLLPNENAVSVFVIVIITFNWISPLLSAEGEHWRI